METRRLKVSEKLIPLIEKPKPLKLAIGGRGSGKSLGVGDIMTMKMDSEVADIYCLREFMDSLEDSVHKVFQSSIEERLGLDGWDVFANKVVSPRGARTRYRGASRNPKSIKSAQGYKYSWFEEADAASEMSLDLLIPTIIRTIGSECWFTGNVESYNDPFSQRFVVPYLDQLMEMGYYEDDIHLIVWINWRDNPWWNKAQEQIRRWDFDNMPRAKYDWIWEGAFNDSVEDPLILPEWFDACVDAHEKLGFDPVGIVLASHDPSDEGEDNKGFACRHGSVLIDLQERTTGAINEGGDWATGLAINHGVDAFTWDCDGMGVGLARDVAQSFSGKPHVIVEMFRGSERADNPDEIYQPVENINYQKSNKETFRNKRIQYYAALRDRMYKTYKAVVDRKYQNPDEMLSLSSDLALLPRLRSELCRMPVKPNRNGLLELYTKEEMKHKHKFKSPNLADSVMMLMRVPEPQVSVTNFQMPQAIRPMGVTGGFRSRRA